jgi:molecular chaperone GrpE
MQKHQTQKDSQNKPGEKAVLTNAEKPMAEDQGSDQTVDTQETSEEALVSSEVEKLKKEVQSLQEKYLRQAAEFDNFRKRTAREKVELMQTAGKDVIISLLTVVDDMDRAEKQMEGSQDVDLIKQGIHLIFQKFRNILQAKGLKQMQTIGEDFNPDLHEAITEIPAPSPELRGKVVDELEKGYYLNDKILRFAKVVVGK